MLLLRLPNHWWNVLFIKRALLMLILLLVSVWLRPQLLVVTLRWELQSTKASELKSILPVGLQRILSYATETGASSWLNALPIHEHGFALHKGAFRDAICLRYGWHPSGLSSTCACSKSFTVEHAMNCPAGGFPTMRHNELRDFIASLLSEVCHNVCVEPPYSFLLERLFH